MPNKHREIKESKDFEKQKAALGDVRRLDEALSGFIWLVSRGPEEFPTIAPNSRVRIAEAGPLFSDEGTLQNYMILFRIESEDAVELLWIEVIPL